ncbi:MAG: hypothetical protein J6X69_00015 [Bacteroidales bacterium]|nr:hypothetical protein [Bacteroidales bacterium]
MEKNKVWKVIVNPHAASGKMMRAWTRINALMDKAQIATDVAFTERKRHAVDLVREAARDGYRRFLAVGGDGTAHELLEGIASVAVPAGNLSEYTLGVMPVGSGNDWAKGHRLGSRPADVIALLKNESFGKQDIVQISSGGEDAYMLNVGGIGFDAMVCRRVNARKDRGSSGKILYVEGLLYNIFHYKPSPIRVKVDGKEVFSGPFYSIAFAIGPYCGGGMRQCPGACFGDGLLDMTLVPRLSIPSLLVKMPRLFTGTLDRVKQLIFARGKEFEIEVLSGTQEMMEADGEIVAATSLKLSIVSQQLNVVSALK